MHRRDDRGDRRTGAREMIRVSLGRRRALCLLWLPAAQALVALPAFASARIASARIWPAQEYTRLIFEAPTVLPHRLIVLRDPHRVVLDLDGVELTPELLQLPARVALTDPYIARIRFGKQPPDVLRV